MCLSIGSGIGAQSAANVAIHRLRQKFGEAIHSEIAETVETEEEIVAELRHLIYALRAGT